MSSADVANPQTFNRYAYVGNNPINLTDPTGMAAQGGGPPSCAEGLTSCTFIDPVTGEEILVIVTSVAKVVPVPAAIATTTAAVIASAPGGAEADYQQAQMISDMAGLKPDQNNAVDRGRDLVNGWIHRNIMKPLLNAMGIGKDDAQETAPNLSTSGETSPADPNQVKPDPESNKPATQSSKPPEFGKGWVKLKGSQGFKDPDGNIWKKDMLHKDHWDISDRKGNKIREVDFDGRQIYPDGPKNKNKTP